MTDPETLNSLRTLLGSKDVDERREAVEALAALEDVPALLFATRSRDAYLRARAVKALAPFSGAKVAVRLLRAARDPEARVREAAALALGARGGWFAVRALKRLSCDVDSCVRYRALVSLAHLGSNAAWAVLDAASSREEEEWVRRSAERLRKLRVHQPTRLAESEPDDQIVIEDFPEEDPTVRVFLREMLGSLRVRVRRTMGFAARVYTVATLGPILAIGLVAGAHSLLHVCPFHFQRFETSEIIQVIYGPLPFMPSAIAKGTVEWGGCSSKFPLTPHGVCPHCRWPVTFSPMADELTDSTAESVARDERLFGPTVESDEEVAEARGSAPPGED